MSEALFMHWAQHASALRVLLLRSNPSAVHLSFNATDQIYHWSVRCGSVVVDYLDEAQADRCTVTVHYDGCIWCFVEAAGQYEATMRTDLALFWSEGNVPYFAPFNPGR